VISRERHREWEHNFVARFGRKFTLSIVVIAVGFVVHMIGMLTIVEVTQVERAREITQVVLAFREVIIAAIFCFAGADALITWKTGTHDPHKAGPGPNKPPPARQSGTIPNVEGE